MASTSVTVLIPVLNAARYLPALFAAFAAQQPRPPDEIILVDSNSTDRTRELGMAAGAHVIPIARFSHGGARNLGARQARGDIVVLLSQDACPANDHWLAELLAPFADPRVAATFSRQVPHPDAKPMEAYFYETHFPDGQPIRREKGARPELGFEDVFLSNVSSAMRREVLVKHPFDEALIMSEDQQFARDVLNAGFATVYQPGSVVVHSHDYTLGEVFRRYFDSVHSLTQIFPNHGHATSARIGLTYLFKEACHMLVRHPLWLPYYAAYVASRSFGTLAGHHADRLPRALLRRFSMHAYHWT
ncbi:MAG: glycosyltransferase family 2 protein [Lentisphaerae bacterium]|nr:glycosyltransferase family 2 protein [Lentisphaerota bacterium]